MNPPILQRQPICTIPLRPVQTKLTFSLGAMALNCYLRLFFDREVEDDQGVAFLVDTGAMFCSIGIDAAIEAGIPVPPESREIEIEESGSGGQHALRVRPGHIRVWWTQDLQGDPFRWPIFFVVSRVEPGRSPQDIDQQPYRNRPPVLGLGGVVTDCRWTAVGPRNLLSNDGYMIFEDTRARLR